LLLWSQWLPLLWSQWLQSLLSQARKEEVQLAIVVLAERALALVLRLEERARPM
jgi:hypothetical protein